MRVTVLGCGGSGGVPLVGGDWGRCDPKNPRNRRRRVSVLVETAGASLLIDASPDLRAQLLDAGVTGLDAVLFTHHHADHCHGLDDLRSLVYLRKAPLPAFMDAETRAELTLRFAYAFTSSCPPGGLYRPLLEDRVIEGTFEAAGVRITPFVQGHGEGRSLGFRIGDLAYSTDVSDLDDAAFGALDGVRLWIVDCLQDAPHPSHSHTAQTLAWIDRLKPERALLTHMNHKTDYAELKAQCPEGVEPAYDGQVVELSAS